MLTIIENGDYALKFERRANGVWIVATLAGRPQLETKVDKKKMRLLRDWLCFLEFDWD